eukprot:478999-Rhodomonas_salina.2
MRQSRRLPEQQDRCHVCRVEVGPGKLIKTATHRLCYAASHLSAPEKAAAICVDAKHALVASVCDIQHTRRLVHNHVARNPRPPLDIHVHIAPDVREAMVDDLCARDILCQGHVVHTAVPCDATHLCRAASRSRSASACPASRRGTTQCALAHPCAASVQHVRIGPYAWLIADSPGVRPLI